MLVLLVAPGGGVARERKHRRLKLNYSAGSVRKVQFTSIECIFMHQTSHHIPFEFSRI